MVKIGVKAECIDCKRAYYPRGGNQVRCEECSKKRRKENTRLASKRWTERQKVAGQEEKVKSNLGIRKICNCGREYYPTSFNQKRCEKCRVEVEKQQRRRASSRYVKKKAKKKNNPLNES